MAVATPRIENQSYLFSAKGAASVLGCGNAPATQKEITTSAESASQSHAPACPPCPVQPPMLLRRASSACSVCLSSWGFAPVSE